MLRQCRVRGLVIAERQHLVANNLSRLVPLASDQEHIAGPKQSDGGADRIPPVADYRRAVCCRQNFSTDGRRIFTAGIVVSDDHIVSQVDLAPTLLSLIGISSEHPMLGADLTRHYPDRAIMQYGDNYGYLSNDTLLVLRPNQPAAQYRYTVEGEKLAPEAVDPQLEKVALAHALWPSWAYGHQRYRLPQAIGKKD